MKIGVAIILFLIGYICGILAEKIIQSITSAHGIFEIAETAEDRAIGIKFTSEITDDTNKIIIKKSR